MISAAIVTLLASSSISFAPFLPFPCLRRAFIWQNVLLGHLLGNCCCCSRRPGCAVRVCVKIRFDYCAGRGRASRGVHTAQKLLEIFISNIYFLQQDMKQKQQSHAFTLMHKQFKQTSGYTPGPPNPYRFPALLHARLAFNYFSGLDCTVHGSRLPEHVVCTWHGLPLF